MEIKFSDLIGKRISSAEARVLNHWKMKQVHEEAVQSVLERHRKQKLVREEYSALLDQKHFARLTTFLDTSTLPGELSVKLKEMLKQKQQESGGRSAHSRMRRRESERAKGFFTTLYARVFKVREAVRTEKQKILKAMREPSTAEDIWRVIARKHILKAQKILTGNYAVKLLNGKKVSALCAREGRKLESRDARAQKEAVGRAKRATREMLLFWKKNEKEEKEARKRAEKEAAEQRRKEEEQREARRQAKKLNFLLTQTELYSHFMAKKGNLEDVQGKKEALPAGIDFADVDDNVLTEEAKRKALQAVEAQRSKTREFDRSSGGGMDQLDFQNPTGLEGEEVISQPSLLQCKLKGYQLKGLTWLAKLYAQGINGILADEMGLGKTVQAISLMSHLAETFGIWGPFLVIAPASTLHNWQQEFAKFVPAFRIIPYWGNVNDRKTLRKSFSASRGEKLHGRGRESPFHVMITSYQLIVTDQPYLNKIKWSFMVLDEAQAIKSGTSQRWKTLLSFDCRNRLLLTGTPIQNSMQELWALLHFIMPSLFDSHDEFSEWFSKDIESHVQSSSALGGFDEHQLRRLHMILKPFMLRRIKRDVESELGQKIEHDVYVEMTARQKRLYQGIKSKIPLSELLKLASSATAGGSTSSLMNLVMQFRKVCNHPELLEKSEIKSPLVLSDESSGGGLFMGKYWTGMHSNPLRIGPVFKRSKLDFPLPPLPPNEQEGDEGIVIKKLLFEPPAVPLVSSNRRVIAADQSNTTSGLKFISWEPLVRNQPFIHVPPIERLIQDSAKMQALDRLLRELKADGHRVLLYNQMTRMIDVMEEYLQYRGYTFIRLDGSCRIADRRDLVHDWQTRPELFVFLLSTRAGGLGINLTAADTVIFYDSDWNPTVDQQAMDRAHRLGQTKQVTVYRLLVKGSIEERMRVRALQKGRIHQMVIEHNDNNNNEEEEEEQLVIKEEDAQVDEKDLLQLLMDEA